MGGQMKIFYTVSFICLFGLIIFCFWNESMDSNNIRHNMNINECICSDEKSGVNRDFNFGTFNYIESSYGGQ